MTDITTGATVVFGTSAFSAELLSSSADSSLLSAAFLLRRGRLGGDFSTSSSSSAIPAMSFSLLIAALRRGRLAGGLESSSGRSASSLLECFAVFIFPLLLSVFGVSLNDALSLFGKSKQSWRESGKWLFLEFGGDRARDNRPLLSYLQLP